MSRAGKLDEAASGNPVGEVLPCCAGCDRVVLAVENKRRHADRSEHPAHVDRRVGACKRRRSARTCASLVVGRKTPGRRWIRVGNELACQLLAAPDPLELPVPILGFLLTEGVDSAARKPCLRPIQDEALDTLRIGRSDHDAERPTFTPAEHMRALQPGGVHHRERIRHALVGGRDARRSVGHAGASLIEPNDAGKSRHPLEPPDPPGLMPVEREMGHPARNQQHVDRPFTSDLVSGTLSVPLGSADERYTLRT